MHKRALSGSGLVVIIGALFSSVTDVVGESPCERGQGMRAKQP
jgi:hypothetical protein